MERRGIFLEDLEENIISENRKNLIKVTGMETTKALKDLKNKFSKVQIHMKKNHLCILLVDTSEGLYFMCTSSFQVNFLSLIQS